MDNDKGPVDADALRFAAYYLENVPEEALADWLTEHGQPTADTATRWNLELALQALARRLEDEADRIQPEDAVVAEEPQPAGGKVPRRRRGPQVAARRELREDGKLTGKEAAVLRFFVQRVGEWAWTADLQKEVELSEVARNAIPGRFVKAGLLETELEPIPVGKKLRTGRRRRYRLPAAQYEAAMALLNPPPAQDEVVDGRNRRTLRGDGTFSNGEIVMLCYMVDHPGEWLWVQDIKRGCGLAFGSLSETILHRFADVGLLERSREQVKVDQVLGRARKLLFLLPAERLPIVTAILHGARSGDGSVGALVAALELGVGYTHACRMVGLDPVWMFERRQADPEVDARIKAAIAAGRAAPAAE